jgi:hypothetical protein
MELEYKDVFLHTSFLEGIIIDKSLQEYHFPFDEHEKKMFEEDPQYQRGFRSALKFLQAKLGTEEYKLLHKIYDDRNNLIHDIARTKADNELVGMDQRSIEAARDQMGHNILVIYRGSHFINELFRDRYGLLPKKEISPSKQR